jgi:hypothetical protein
MKGRASAGLATPTESGCLTPECALRSAAETRSVPARKNFPGQRSANAVLN